MNAKNNDGCSTFPAPTLSPAPLPQVGEGLLLLPSPARGRGAGGEGAEIQQAAWIATPKTGVARTKPARVVLLPTAAGIGWALAALVMLATATNYGNNLVFALAFLLLSIWLSSGRECWRNLAGLQWLPAPEAAAFAGESLCLSGTLRDVAGRPRAPIMLCAGKGRRVPGNAVGTTTASGATPEGQITLELTLPARERGRQRVGGLRLLSFHPLGLWSARRSVPDMTALVYPRPAGERPLPGNAPNPAHRQQASGDFQGLRAYAPGDAPRRVNWRVYARRGELAVNNFDGGAGGHTLWLDIAACEGDIETRLSQLCRWICEAERQGREYGLRGARLDGGQDRPPGRGRAHQRVCLARLALCGNDSSAGAVPCGRPSSPGMSRVLNKGRPQGAAPAKTIPVINKRDGSARPVAVAPSVSIVAGQGVVHVD